MALVNQTCVGLAVETAVARTYKPALAADGMPVGMVRCSVSQGDGRHASVWRGQLVRGVSPWLSPALALLVGLSGVGCAKSQRDFAVSKGEADAAAGAVTGPDASPEGSEGTAGSEPGATSEQPQTTSGGASATPSSSAATSDDVPTDAPGVTSHAVGSSETPDNGTESTGDEPGDTGAGTSEPASGEPGVTSDTATDQTGPDTSAPRCNENILINGDFEAGKEHWSVTSNYGAFEQRVHPLIVENGDASLTDYSVTAYSGTHFAFLGDIPDDEFQGYGLRLAQPVYIPEGALGLVLKGYVWVSTNESDDMEFDYGYIELQPPGDDDKVEQFKFWTNRDPMTDWVQINEYTENLDLVRGQTVDFVVQAQMDATTATRFWFDSLELIVICPE